MTFLFIAIVVIAVFFVLIFIHEAGHFAFAKMFGIRVDEFGFGFPPRLWGKKVGETIYSINWLPFGGFVKIFGENADEEGPRSFISQRPWKRFLVLVAGAFMNFVLGWAIITGLFATSGIRMPVTEETMPYAHDIQLTIAYVAPDSPAQAAGVIAGDVVQSITKGEENAAETVVPASYDEFVAYIDAHRGEELHFNIRRGNEHFALNITPRVDPPENEGALGIAIPETALIKYPGLRAASEGLKLSADMSQLVLSSFFGMIKDIVTTARPPGDVVGPVGLVGVIADATKFGLASLLQLMALISLNLAVLNLLPIPALDGGRIVFLAVEAVRGAPASRRFEQISHGVGFALLIALLIIVSIRDVGRLF